ncbi:protein of unknown function, partial (plasmid) [Azospirillum baldaniorum]
MSERTRDRHWVPPMELDPTRAAAVPPAEEEGDHRRSPWLVRRRSACPRCWRRTGRA